MAKQAQKKALTKTELKKLQELVATTNELKKSTHDLDIAHALKMRDYIAKSNELDAYGIKLEKKYGSVNVNIETGEFADEE